MFALALDDAVRNSGLSVSVLAKRLGDRGTPVSVAALRSWRRGVRHPEGARSLDALDNLEEILRLPRGHLAARLGPTRRLSPDRAQHYEDLVGRDGPLASMKQSLDLDCPSELERIGDSRVVVVGKDARSWSVTKRVHWRARANGARRAPDMLHLEHPTHTPPEVAARDGVTLGRHVWDAASGFGVWELVLDHPLALGETATTEHRIDVVEAVDLPNYWMIVERRIAFSALCIRWHDSAPPLVELHEETGDDARVHVRRASGRSIHHAVTGFGPGAFGFEWDAPK